MQLLIITNNPERASFRQRIGVYLDLMARDGIQCEVAVLPKGMFARAKLFKRAAEFDCVFLHKKLLNIADAWLLRKYARRIIFNYDDAIMFSYKNPERKSRSRLVPFGRTVRLSDMSLVGSEYLADRGRPFSNNIKVLSLGLNVSEYFIEGISRDDDKIRLVWVGSESTLGYLEDIKPALEKIGQKFTNVVLRIVGDTFFDLDNMPVEKLKWQKNKLGDYLTSSDIGLAPLPDNNFTQGKCSFKVLEYSSAQLPVVASPVGTNGEHVVDGQTGFIVSNEQQWVGKISQLIEDDDLRRQMGKDGRVHAQKHDVSVIGQQLCSIIKNCIDTDK
ncbi:MAG: glycosyltransferase family 4 protein [Anaerohalosphaera sp.]|nr:glycosyltransferase family 4 protein [Anaerohalosphaera sp.]